MCNFKTYSKYFDRNNGNIILPLLSATNEAEIIIFNHYLNLLCNHNNIVIKKNKLVINF